MTNPATTNQTTQDKTSVWKLDPSHSQVEFSAKHMMFTTVKGHFQQFDAEIDWDETDFTKSSVSANIKADSIFTGEERRDAHLRSGDFFLVEEHPEISFKSTRIEGAGDNEYNVYGDLTVRGITKEVKLQTTFEGRGVNPWGKEVAAFEARTSINRKDFGLNWNVALEAGGVLVGDTIKIELHIEIVKETEQAA
jgi:polyisoprenoid-binding protein YceI